MPNRFDLPSNPLMSLQQLPPPWPLIRTYTACYCEENIYLLAQELLTNTGLAALWDLRVVFISNASRSVSVHHFCYLDLC